MQLVNLTPHAISLFTPGGVKELPPSGQLCRVRSASETIGEIEGIAVTRPTFEDVSGLPEPSPNVTYLVSGLVITALKARGIHRPDIVAPATGPNDGPIRDAQGRIQGVTRLSGM